MLLFTRPAVPKYGGFAHSKDFFSFFVWKKKRQMSLPTTPCLFLVSVGFAPTRAAKVTGEPTNTELSSSSQHTVHIIDLVSWWHSALSTSTTSMNRYKMTEKQHF